MCKFMAENPLQQQEVKKSNAGADHRIPAATQTATTVDSRNSLAGEYVDSTSPSNVGAKSINRSQGKAWTVAVDLSIVFDEQGNHGRLGAEDKERTLEDLAAETRDKPLSIVVQSVVPTGNAAAPYTLERRVIKDGAVGEPTRSKSEGTTADLEHLVQYASHEEHADKIALVMNVHGLGDEGVSGGSRTSKNGHADVNDLIGAISHGLDGSTHAKIDMLDFDSCLMGQLGVANQMAQVTDHIVVSELPETAASAGTGPSVDSQNLNAWIDALIKDPTMDGKQLADTIVAAAANHANEGVVNGTKYSGTPTLAHFELGPEREQFMQSMDQLGDSLNQLIQTSKGRLIIGSIIDRMKDLAAVDEMGGPSDGDPNAAKFDLDLFLYQLKLASAAPGFFDKSAQLRSTIDDVTNKEKFMLASVYVEGKSQSTTANPTLGGFMAPPSLGGVSIFLPKRELRDTSNMIGAFAPVALQRKQSQDGAVPAPPKTKLERTYEDLVSLEFDPAQRQSNGGWHKFLLALKNSP